MCYYFEELSVGVVKVKVLTLYFFYDLGIINLGGIALFISSLSPPFPPAPLTVLHPEVIT